MKKKPAAGEDEVMAAYRKKYPNIPDVMVPNSDAGPHMQEDPNLDFMDEADAYHKFKSHGYFTPNPAGGMMCTWIIVLYCISVTF